MDMWNSEGLTTCSLKVFYPDISVLIYLKVFSRGPMEFKMAWFDFIGCNFNLIIFLSHMHVQIKIRIHLILH